MSEQRRGERGPAGQLPPPGWYPYPGWGWRWWDGNRWAGEPPAGLVEAPREDGARLSRSSGEREASGSPAEGGEGQPGARIPLRAAWWAVLGIAAGEVLGFLLAEIAYAATGKSNGAATVLAGELGLWAGMIGACLGVSRRYGTGSLARDFGLRFRRSDLWAGMAAAAAGLLVSDGIGAAFAHTRFAGTNTQILTGHKGNTVAFAVVTVVVAVGAPFFEELFFRGLLRTAFASRLGPIAAIWAQAACFGLAHYEPQNGLGNVSVMVAIGALGVILGYTAYLTRRLAAGMVGHCLFNTVVSVIVLVT